jgi:hypothetical protein
MKRRTLIFIPLILLITAVVVVIFFNLPQEPAWKAMLNQYLAFLTNSGRHSYQVISVASASSPGNFTPSMSAQTYNESVVFQSTQGSVSGYAVGLQPVLYPPQQLICVLLNVDSQQQLVYVALHNNPDDANWVVHISSESWGSPLLPVQLSSIGCSLET